MPANTPFFRAFVKLRAAMNATSHDEKDGARDAIWGAISFGSHDDDALRGLLHGAKTRACAGVTLPLKLDDETAQEQTRRALGWCRELSLAVWLRIEYSNLSLGAPYVACQTRDAATGETLASSREGDALSLTVVPRDSEGELAWTRARKFAPHDVPRRLETASRLFLWREYHDATRAFDALDRAHAEQLLSSTGLAWEKLGEEARAVVRGVSVAVPASWDEDAPNAANRFVWSAEMASRFRALNGYEIVENLASLVADSGQNAVRVRHDFRQTVALLLQENFIAPWQNWARENGLKLQWRLRANGLNRFVARYGALALWSQNDEIALETEGETKNESDEIKHSSDTILLKLARSLAAADVENDDQTDVETARRATLCFLDSPPLFAFHRALLAGATRFEMQLKSDDSVARAALLNRYLARQISELQNGRSGARVGVLWPEHSLWAHHHPKGHKFVRWVEEDIFDVADWLDDLRFDWLFIDEASVQNAPIENRVLDARQSKREKTLLLCGAARLPLEVVVLPSLTFLSRATWARLEEFAGRGGRILCLGLLPRWSEIGRDAEQEKRVETQTRCWLDDVYRAYKREGAPIGDEDALLPSSVGYPILRQTPSGGRMVTYQPRLNLERDDARLRVRPMLTESLEPDLETRAPGLRYTRRNRAHSSLFWVWNTRRETLQANLILRSAPAADIEETPLWRDVSSSDISSSGEASFRETLSGEATSGEATSSTRLPIWMPLRNDEGGGVALSFEIAANQVRAIEIHALTDENGEFPHGESANFTVESFDGSVARGHVNQSGTPMIAVRENGKLLWWKGENVVVPTPILLHDWEVESAPNADGAPDADEKSPIEYSKSVAVPPAWRSCRVRLEIAALQPEQVVEVRLARRFVGRRFAPPLGFDLDVSSLGETEKGEIALELSLRLEPPRDSKNEPLARLVAYPLVEVRPPADSS